MRVDVLGARGSMPAAGNAFLRYGGDTPSLAITPDGGSAPTLLLDAGTGITHVPRLLGPAAFAGTLLLTHLHWDHVQGLPFCSATDNPASRVSLRLPAQPDGAEAVDVLAGAMSPPHFPITPRELRGAWDFAALTPGEHSFEGFSVTALEVPHKGGRTFGYRISDERSTVAYIPDHCPTELGPGEDGFGARHSAAVELAQNADVLVHDAQLLASELDQAADGHAVVDYSVGLARAVGVRRLLLVHHKPTRTDEQLDALAQRFSGDARVVVAADGLVLEL